MKKRFLFVLLSLVLALSFVLAGCGESGDNGSGSDQSSGSGSGSGNGSGSGSGSGNGSGNGSGSSSGDEETWDVDSIALDQSALTLKEGAEQQLTATLQPSNSTAPVAWTSADPNVAMVYGGKVTALSCGNTTITATANGKTASCTVRVDVDGEFDSFPGKNYREALGIFSNLSGVEHMTMEISELRFSSGQNSNTYRFLDEHTETTIVLDGNKMYKKATEYKRNSKDEWSPETFPDEEYYIQREGAEAGTIDCYKTDYGEWQYSSITRRDPAEAMEEVYGVVYDTFPLNYLQPGGLKFYTLLEKVNGTYSKVKTDCLLELGDDLSVSSGPFVLNRETGLYSAYLTWGEGYIVNETPLFDFKVGFLSDGQLGYLKFGSVSSSSSYQLIIHTIRIKYEGTVTLPPEAAESAN